MIKVEWTNADALDLPQLATDCISRQMTIEALCSVCGVDCNKSEFVYGGKQEEQVILCPEHYVLTQLPSAQPERPKGHWVEVSGFATPGGDTVWECSECGKGRHVYGIEHRSYGSDVSDGQWVSCPNCGADMRGE